MKLQNHRELYFLKDWIHVFLLLTLEPQKKNYLVRLFFSKTCSRVAKERATYIFICAKRITNVLHIYVCPFNGLYMKQNKTYILCMKLKLRFLAIFHSFDLSSTLSSVIHVSSNSCDSFFILTHFRNWTSKSIVEYIWILLILLQTSFSNREQKLD